MQSALPRASNDRARPIREEHYELNSLMHFRSHCVNLLLFECTKILIIRSVTCHI